MSERVALAREVAFAKHHSGAPVHDPVREAALLARLADQAGRQGVARDRAEAFFTAQIAASRQVQTELLGAWARGEPVPVGTPADLQTDLRPRLDVVTAQLLDALAAPPPSDGWRATASSVRQRLLADGFSDATTRFAVAPLETWAAAEQRDETRDRQHRRLRRLRPQPASAHAP